MDFPLTKTELKAVKAIRKMVKQNPNGFISEQDYQQWQDILFVMKARNVIIIKKHYVFQTNERGFPIACAKLGKMYYEIGDIDIFYKWIMERHRNAKRHSRLAWLIPVSIAILPLLWEQLKKFL